MSIINRNPKLKFAFDKARKNEIKDLIAKAGDAITARVRQEEPLLSPHENAKLVKQQLRQYVKESVTITGVELPYVSGLKTGDHALDGLAYVGKLPFAAKKIPGPK